MLDEAGRASLLEQAIFSLQDKLRVASRLEGRCGAIEALLAVVEFLSTISGRDELLHQRPLNALLSALMSLNDGKVLPLLEPVRRPGSPRNSVGMGGVKAMAVFTVRQLCGIGLAPDLACEKVALVCRKAGIRPGRRGASHRLCKRGWTNASGNRRPGPHDS